MQTSNPISCANQTIATLLCQHPSIPSVERIKIACQQHDVPLIVRDAATLLQEQDPRQYGVILCRFPSGTNPSQLLPLLPFEQAGIPFINRPSSCLRAHDKASALHTLEDSGLPVPPTIRVDRDSPANLDGLPGERFVVKPAQGSSGRGVTMNLSRTMARAAADAFADLSGPVLIQPLLGGGIDHRLLLIDGNLVAAMIRTPDESDRGSLAYGARAQAWKPSTKAIHLAQETSRILDLDVVAVDLLEHNDGFIILEANCCPGFKGIEEATGIDAAGALAQLVKDRLMRLS